MEFNTVVDWLRKAYALPDLQPAGDGTCWLQFGPLAVGLSSQVEPPGLLIRSEVGLAQSHYTDDDVEALLAANLFADGAGWSAFGMEDDGRLVLIQRAAYQRLTRERFLSTFRRFALHGQYWHQQVAGTTEHDREPLQTLLANEALFQAAPATPLTPPSDTEFKFRLEELARLLEAQVAHGQVPGEGVLHFPYAPPLHLRHQPLRGLFQCAALIGASHAYTRSRLMREMLRSNRMLSDRMAPHLALTHPGRDVALCKAIRIDGPQESIAPQEFAALLRELVQAGIELRRILAGQGLLVT